MKLKLNLAKSKISRARALAASITRPIQEYVAGHTTQTVERATLRALGADGTDSGYVPVPNLIIKALGKRVETGAAAWYINAMLHTGKNPTGLNKAITEGLDISVFPMADKSKITSAARPLIRQFSQRVKQNVKVRNAGLYKYRKNAKSPMLYLIVATGNIYEDVKQASAAARQGADAVAVIRSTAQSLLDYVPFGPTIHGIGGTYATQENFRIMRQALDKVMVEEKRYVRLVNYASGLCMPEISVMGALERLDMMLNDSMYGILFRDINMYRTFVDQHFSRQINAFADIIINTGEDNYLTTADAYYKAFTVFASQFINERLAKNAGLEPRLMGLGHAFEIDPSMRNSFLYEIAQAQMARELFPDAPLKYMPPTKFMTGNIFQGHVLDTMFNFASAATGQSIHLLGMLSEAVQNPFMQDRYLSLENAKYVQNAMADFHKEVDFKKGGIISKRADQVLDQTLKFLERVNKHGLFKAIARGMFADIKRSPQGGKGKEGVFPKAPGYWNPVEDFLERSLKC